MGLDVKEPLPPTSRSKPGTAWGPCCRSVGRAKKEKTRASGRDSHHQTSPGHSDLLCLKLGTSSVKGVINTALGLSQSEKTFCHL